MTRFHISKKGAAARCTAQEGACPLKQDDGSPEEHYSTREEAQAAAEAREEAKHGLTVTLKKDTPSARKTSTLSRLKDLRHYGEAVAIISENDEKKVFSQAERLAKQGHFVVMTVEDVEDQSALYLTEPEGVYLDGASMENDDWEKAGLDPHDENARGDWQAQVEVLDDEVTSGGVEPNEVFRRYHVEAYPSREAYVASFREEEGNALRASELGGGEPTYELESDSWSNERVTGGTSEPGVSSLASSLVYYDPDARGARELPIPEAEKKFYTTPEGVSVDKTYASGVFKHKNELTVIQWKSGGRSYEVREKGVQYEVSENPANNRWPARSESYRVSTSGYWKLAEQEDVNTFDGESYMYNDQGFEEIKLMYFPKKGEGPTKVEERAGEWRVTPYGADGYPKAKEQVVDEEALSPVVLARVKEYRAARGVPEVLTKVGSRSEEFALIENS